MSSPSPRQHSQSSSPRDTTTSLLPSLPQQPPLVDKETLQLWLAEYFPADPSRRVERSSVPYFEDDEVTHSVLSNLYHVTQSAREWKGVLQKNEVEQLKNNQQMGDALENIPKVFRCAPEQLSSVANSQLLQLVTMAQELNVYSISPLSQPSGTIPLKCAIEDLHHSRVTEELQLRKWQRKTEALKRKTDQMNGKLQSVNQVLSHIDSLATSEIQDVIKEREEAIEFAKYKDTEYKSRQANIQNELTQRGFTPNLTHEALLELHDQYEQLLAEVEILNSEYQKVGVLPPDLALAQREVDALRNEIAVMDREVQQRIDSMQDRGMP